MSITTPLITFTSYSSRQKPGLPVACSRPCEFAECHFSSLRSSTFTYRKNHCDQVIVIMVMSGNVRAAKRHFEHLVRDGPPGQPRLQWGFVIYRTAYGPGSDELWQSLLGQIQSAVQTSILALAQPSIFRPDEQVDPEHVAVCHQLASLFHLDTREDERTLGGASMDSVREIAKREVEAIEAAAAGGMGDDEHQLTRREANLHRNHVFLYVDDQVLQQQAIRQHDKTTGLIKVVEVDHDASRHGPHPRIGPQRDFGAMIACLDSLNKLWEDIEGEELSRFAPPMKDGDAAVMWDGGPGATSQTLGDTVSVRIRDGGILEFI
ncbi:hypothetical protein B0H66DRAFT_565376 [Apodospora peruviana]|uniref:Uncharacterized protein n=1 Tax=Apodospora peruviana TaxID=516989 RepID=A0AAE0HZN5_9PEZI|nr:hypothetical protein B0H66DRAFT_565376 [Apodospora peruviana]